MTEPENFNLLSTKTTPPAIEISHPLTRNKITRKFTHCALSSEKCDI